jgi:hypothetical protein
MTRRTLFATLLCALCATLLLAADFSGTWSGTAVFGDNQFPLTYVFKQDGEKLTGSVTGPGGEIPLAEGKAAGDKISFSVTVDMNGNAAKFVSEGTLKGEEIALVTTGGGVAAGSVTLKRTK